MKLSIRTLLPAIVAIGISTVVGVPTTSKCKCGPDDNCWPSNSTWNDFNRLVGNRLIKSEPIAQSCYPGPAENRTQCDYVNANWAKESFQISQPLGLNYPWNLTCPPVNYAAGETPKSCSLGQNPRYAVNATTISHIRDTLAFASAKNIRLVVKSTGHDLIGRSDGYGSLELWLRNFRNGINFQSSYPATTQCKKSTWSGSAIQINGGYQWTDVYAVAKNNNVIVVGGGAPSVGAVGGFAVGGGHGPASRNYGLAADQILEAKVMLACGDIVTANACENSDLYKSLRGGGPGYGVILSLTMKAHPNVDLIASQRLDIVPVGGNNSALLDAVAVLFQSYPGMNDAGFCGYGMWALNSITPIFGNAFAGYSHTFWNFGKDISVAKQSFAPIRARLDKLSEYITINETYRVYSDYWSMYEAESGVVDSVGVSGGISSHLFDTASVSDYQKVRSTLNITTGAPDEFAVNTLQLVSGGQVTKDAADPFSGLNPAWRKSPFVYAVSMSWAPGSSEAIKQTVRDDLTFIKGTAQKALAPNTGGYMNEGDRNDPDWANVFYGTNYAFHSATKKKYDPYSLFYCTTCVGSEAWTERPETPLCRV